MTDSYILLQKVSLTDGNYGDWRAQEIAEYQYQSRRQFAQLYNARLSKHNELPSISCQIIPIIPSFWAFSCC